MVDFSSPACPTCHAALPRLPRARSKCRACNHWMYPSFRSVFQSTLLTKSQHTVTKALAPLQEKSPANARVVSQALPQLRAVWDDKGGLGAGTSARGEYLAPRPGLPGIARRAAPDPRAGSAAQSCICDNGGPFSVAFPALCAAPSLLARGARGP